MGKAGISEARRAAPGPVIEAFHGKLDRAVPYAACKKSIAVLKTAGFAANLTSYDDSGHEITRDEAKQVWAALDRAIGAAGAAKGTEQPHPAPP
jgi:phospholipase/carboxylesterase